ncbi:pilus assembly protein [Mesorhizobium sp. YC-39]|uniref:TadE/TadG family type IV pilus assembly protein n=1 Tax=unclassified Mesorhizobium TaxID=325217 RepID=UPI0021E86C17|nr:MULTISPECIES: TadE/TadG family type IV pilus assembly protein [unclassified Mesorhizobium]MCV3205834.1 pilus assembly protein [Mesorhizobium sp. YC-2]MCV3227767.1 pilus assembly protein [Mesorhizobium sp. YC-39]
MVRAGAPMGIAGIYWRANRFCRDRRGVAAIEFALIVPILLIMYFVTMEASQAIETSKKVSRIGSMVADLVTQQQSVKTADLDAIMQIGNSTLQPYNRSTPKIVITAIKVTNETPPKVQVVWSRKMVDGAFSADAAKDSITTVPPTLEIRDTFLIRVESNLVYEPIITWTADNANRLGFSSVFAKIPMGETYFLRARRSPTIPCGDC